MKKALLLLSIVIIGYIIISGNWYIKCPTDIEKKKNLVIDIQGVVAKKYFDKKNHGIATVIVKNYEQNIHLSFYRRYEYTTQWNKIEVGDSVYKSKGEMDLIVKSKKENWNTKYIQYICDPDNIPNWE